MQANELEFKTPEGVSIFGIRHLSPAGAWHLERLLEKSNPDLVLIEGPCDATPLALEAATSKVEPPFALMCYTLELPSRSLVCPLAEYSPEYRALLWSVKNGKTAWLMDLPFSVSVCAHSFQNDWLRQKGLELTLKEGKEDLGEELSLFTLSQKNEHDIRHKLFELFGEEDFESYWERLFEHDLSLGAYQKAVSLHEAEARKLTDSLDQIGQPPLFAYNFLREAHMKKEIAKAISEGYKPEKIIAVCGAHHVTGIASARPMTPKELAGMPSVKVKMALMPYSYYKLSSYSGYGAGNKAPRYFELMWHAMEDGRLDSFTEEYMADVSASMREKHGYSSTATAIDAARLARAVAVMHDSALPTLKDLHDSVVSVMGGGYEEACIDAFAKSDIGRKVGSVPEGATQAPIQADMSKWLKRLKLERYRTGVAETLQLDLRENRRVKIESAFLDLDRSVFLKRLTALRIEFATQWKSKQTDATWSETWKVLWVPEVEMQLAEASVYGETIETASEFYLKETIANSIDLKDVSGLVRSAYECRLMSAAKEGIEKLQLLAGESESFSPLAEAARELSTLIQYGSVRRYETGELEPFLSQIFVKCALLLLSCSNVDYEEAKKMSQNMLQLHYITQELPEAVNDALWLEQLGALAVADSKNPLLCGFALSILLERGSVSEEMLSTELSRRLSQGNDPEDGATWFEGLALRNRQMLLSRMVIWKMMDEYLSSLDDENFKRALVCLRRALSSFKPIEKTGVCEILAGLWNIGVADAAQILGGVLSKEEEDALENLNDFDFGDFL
jgi:hypothetical protein